MHDVLSEAFNFFPFSSKTTYQTCFILARRQTRGVGVNNNGKTGDGRYGDEDRCRRKSTPSYPIDYFNDLFLVDVVMRAERTTRRFVF